MMLSEADKKLAEECGMEIDVDVMLFFSNELAVLLAKVREDERKDFHAKMMVEWNRPSQIGDAHIGDRLRDLK